MVPSNIKTCELEALLALLKSLDLYYTGVRDSHLGRRTSMKDQVTRPLADQDAAAALHRVPVDPPALC